MKQKTSATRGQIAMEFILKKSEGDASIKINTIKQLNVLDIKMVVPQLWSES